MITERMESRIPPGSYFQYSPSGVHGSLQRSSSLTDRERFGLWSSFLIPLFSFSVIHFFCLTSMFLYILEALIFVFLLMGLNLSIVKYSFSIVFSGHFSSLLCILLVKMLLIAYIICKLRVVLSLMTSSNSLYRLYYCVCLTLSHT